MEKFKTIFKAAWTALLILVLYGVLQGSAFLSVGETYSPAGSAANSLTILQQENFLSLAERSPGNGVLSLLNRRRDARNGSSLRKRQLHSGDPLLKNVCVSAEKLFFCKKISPRVRLMAPGLIQTKSNTPVRAGPETFLS